MRQTRWAGNFSLSRPLVAFAVTVLTVATARADIRGHFPSPRWNVGIGQKVSGSLAGVVDALAKRGLTRVASPVVRIDPLHRVQVRVQLHSLDRAARAALENAGLEIEIENEQLHIVRGWIPSGLVWQLAALESVKRITPPDYRFTRTGSVTGEHDYILRCDDVRSTFGVDGSGVRIGVISDGIDSIESSQATGDAPVVTVPTDPRCRAGSGDEGSAIVELVHDCAPGAEIAFCGPQDDLEMTECIACLHQVFGADVIVDDLGFAEQPYFADGLVAQAVKGAVEAGVAYFSAAGNEAQDHYQGRYRSCTGGERHRFAVADCTLDFRFAGELAIVLQWDERFGAAGSNYDACVPSLGCSEDIQDGDDDPIEIIAITCGHGSCPAGLEIYKRSGIDAELEVFFIPLGASGVELLEHRVTVDSVFGHQCVTGSFAIGAIDARRPPFNAIERYSSRGPCTIRFPSPEKRLKPDLAGVDGISNTRPGGFPSPFYGTSAAAPGVAAVAALLLDLNPTLSAAELRTALETTAVDLGTTGQDITFGFGRVDAFDAAMAVVPPGYSTPTPTGTPTPVPTPGPCIGDCDASDTVTVDELVQGVAISLGDAPLENCPGFDSDGSGTVTVDELVQAVNSGLTGCTSSRSFSPSV